MKIIQLILGKGNPERMNGVNKVVDSLANTMFKQELDVEVWGITPNKKTGKQHDTPFMTRLFEAQSNHFHLDPELIIAIQNQKEEVVFHMHGAFIPEFYACSKLFAKENIPFVFTPHGSYNKFALQKSFLKKLIYYIMFERVLLKNVNYLHLLGRNERSYITKLTPEKKIVVIPNGQHLDKAPDVAVEVSSNLVFGFMGRIDIRHKGLDHMLNGFAKYIKVYHGMGQLWLLGDGDDMDKVKEMISRLRIENSCIVYGSKFGEEKVDLMKQFDVFLHTSRYEGIPMAVLESALMGIPCIVSDATNVKEEVQQYEAGIGLDNTRTETIARAFVAMEQNKQSGKINSMKQNAIQLVNNEYDWNKIVLRFSKIYNEIVK